MNRRAVNGLALLLLVACAGTPPQPAFVPPLPKKALPAWPRPVLDAPGEVLTWARYDVPPDLHEPLGLTREAFATRPPMPLAALVALRRWAAALAGAAEGCLPVLTWNDAAGQPQRTPVEAWAALTVAPGGAVTDVVVRADDQEPVEAALQCAAAAVTRWTFPAQVTGGRAWVPLTARGPEVARSTPAPGTDLVLPISSPSPKPPRCVVESIRLPRDAQGLYPSMVVRFAVSKAGVPGRFKVVTPADLPLDVVAALESGVRQCEWTPARDGNGEPVSTWVVLPIRFSTE